MTKHVDGDQALPDMPDAPGLPTHISFVGMGTESHADVFEYDAEHEFKVRGRVVLGPTREKMADGHERQLVKVRVESIQPLSYNEPTPPSPVQDIPPDGDRTDIGNN